MFNKIITHAANDIEKINFLRLSDDLILKELKDYSFNDISVNLSFLIKNAVRFDKTEVLDYILSEAVKNGINLHNLKYLNVEFCIKSKKALELLQKYEVPVKYDLILKFNGNLEGCIENEYNED